MPIEYNKPKGTILSILSSDGKFHQVVTAETVGAVKRDWETKDGKKGTKYELIADAVTGAITDIGIYEGDFGKQIQVAIGEGADLVTLFISTLSPFGEDFMKKLPNLKPGVTYRFAPYAFEDDKGKSRKGITIYEGTGPDIKIGDYYHKKESDKVIAINGYPEVPTDSDKFDSEDWKLFFGTARKFLVEETKKHPLYNATAAKSDKIEYPQEDISPDQIPF